MTEISDQERPVDYGLLSRCLAFSEEPIALQELRLELLSSRDCWERVYASAKTVRLAPSVFTRLADRTLIPPKRSGSASEILSPAHILESLNRQNLELRQRQTEILENLLEALNKDRIEPVLIKGARSLWLNITPWRTMRDLDLLVSPDAIDRAQEIVIKLGFVIDPNEALRPNRHHWPPLFRSDLNFYVEMHQRAGNRYAEPFFPTAELIRRSHVEERKGLRARVLPDGDEIWQNLVHHFFGHSGFARGTLDYKGHFEFAAAIDKLDESSLSQLRALSNRCSMGLAAFDLWIAAAHNDLGITLPDGIHLQRDAEACWAIFLDRRQGNRTGESKYPGYRQMAGLALAPHRLRTVAAETGQSRLTVAIKALSKLLPKISRTGTV